MYRKKKRSWAKHLDFTIADMICLMAAMLLAYAWRFKGAWLFDETLLTSTPWRRLFFVTLLLDVVAVFFTEAYTGILMRTRYQELTATVKHCLTIFGLILVYMYATKVSTVYSRPTLFVFLFLAIFLEYAERVILKRIIRRRKLHDINKTEMIVVGEGDKIELCLHEIAHDKYMDFKVTGVAVIDRDLTGTEIQGVPVVATADTFMEYVRTHVVDEVFIDGNTISSTEALGRELVEFGVTVHMVLVHTDKKLPNSVIENYANYVTLTSSMHIASNRQLFLKRCMDILGALVGLLITGVAFVIFAPIIKAQSPGPVFFSQIRIGQNGRRFKFYKFRTMYMDAEARKKELMEQNQMHGNMFKMENDPRIIPIGHFMRKHSIDELPQFWNVLKGDMSLVGTRPPTEDEFEQYEYHHKARLGFKPGLTGVWQTSGRSDITDFEEVVALDTEYISNWSLLMDIKIIFKTVAVVFTGKGSR